MTRTKTVPKQTTTYEITLVNDPAPTFYYNNSWNNGNSCMPNEEELHGKITQVIEMNDFLLLKVTGKVDEDAEKTFLLIVTKETELKTGHLNDLTIGKTLDAEIDTLEETDRSVIAEAIEIDIK